MTRTVLTHSEEETVQLGRDLALSLGPGCVVLLHGELGAGKTAFVRGLAAGLGVPDDEVSSPTFMLIQQYRGRMPLVHVDLYRITAAETEELGLDDLGERGVIAIEWGEKLIRPPAEAVQIVIEDAGATLRRITMTVP